MGVNLLLRDETLETAGVSLIAAAARMRDSNVARPTDHLVTVLKIGEQVTELLLGLQLARFALADAAKTAVTAITTVKQTSEGLDSAIAGALQPGFSMPGGRH